MSSNASDSAILRTWRNLPPPSSSSLVKLSQLTNSKYESPQFFSGEHNCQNKSCSLKALLVDLVCLSLRSRMGSNASDSAILKTWRDLPPPSSSLVKLSQLTNSKYESPQFMSGGHNWRLVLYPKGNEEDNGSGFVSMYVECLSSTPSMDVFAYLTFFVFNKKENKYLSLQDVEVKRFKSSKSLWGLSQAVSLETLNDPANGFVFEGECEFGAHVKIASPPVSVDENLPFHKFTWSFRDFSLLKQNDYVSKTFPMGEKKWTLKLYPKGDSSANGELSMFLHLADAEILLAGEMIFVRAQLRVLDPRGSKDLTCSLNSWVMASNKAWGLPQSMSVEEGYLGLGDTLNVEIECEIVNVIKNRPFF